jgi:hypothetical protein
MFDDITKSEFNPMYHIEKIRKVEIWGDLVRGVDGWFTPFFKKNNSTPWQRGKIVVDL